MARPVATPPPVAEPTIPRELLGGEAAPAASPAAAARPPGEPRGIGYLYLLPAFVVFGLFVLFPLGHSFWLSLFNWDGLTPGTWVGFDNYVDVVSDPALRNAFVHSAVLIVFYSVLPVCIGLMLAGIVARTRVRGLTFFRTVLFLPQVMALVVVAIMWRMIYDPASGTINEVLRTIGLGSLAQDWLGDFSIALPAVGLVGTWVMYGLAMVLFMAGVQKIPRSLYDAARVDGAGPVREFFAVTLPALRGEIGVATTLTMIAALRNFDLIYNTTKGGPGDATSVPAYQVYDRAFQTGQVGSAAAIGLSLAIVIFLLTIGVNKLADRAATT